MSDLIHGYRELSRILLRMVQNPNTPEVLHEGTDLAVHDLREYLLDPPNPDDDPADMCDILDWAQTMTDQRIIPANVWSGE